MNVETILHNKGRAVATVRPDDTVGAAVDALVSRNIGALVASEDGERVDGIISERDIVHALAHHGSDLLSLTVAEVMTRSVITCEPTQSVDELMAEMTNRRIRNFQWSGTDGFAASLASAMWSRAASTKSNTRQSRCVRSSRAPEPWRQVVSEPKRR